MKTIRVEINPGNGGAFATAEVMRSGRYVGLDLTDSEARVTVSLDADELAQLVSALVTVQAEVIAQNF